MIGNNNVRTYSIIIIICKKKVSPRSRTIKLFKKQYETFKNESIEYREAVTVTNILLSAIVLRHVKIIGTMRIFG